MTRITKESLKSRVCTLNIMLERPTTIFSADATASQQNIGHLYLDKDAGGYKLVEIISGNGAEANWSPRLQPKDMDLFIDGIIKGISLRNMHIGVKMINNELMRHANLPAVALYDPVNNDRLHELRNKV